MKKIRVKSFFVKSVLLHIFLVAVISFISIIFWENGTYDAMINAVPTAKTGSEEIVLVVIDDKSLEAHRWPWKRSLYGDVFEYFNKYTNAKVVGFDSILHSLDAENPESDKQFFNVVKQSTKFVGGFMGQGGTYEDNEAGNEYDKLFQNKFGLRINDKRSQPNNGQSSYNSLVTYPKPYFDVLRHAGSVNLTVSGYDGVLRTSDDLISYKNNLYPSFALKMYMLSKGTNGITLTNKNLFAEDTELKIAVSNNYGNITHNIKFYQLYPNSEYSHQKYSAIDIINSRDAIKNGKKPIVEPSEFDNKIVIVGANAKAAALGLEDILSTTVSFKHPGVDVQATILENFLHNEYIVKTTPAQNIALICLLSVITFLCIRFFSFIVSLVLLILVASIYTFICWICFSNNIAPLVITPIAVQLSTMIFGYSYRFILEGKNKEKIKNAMGRYLSQDIMKNVVKNIDNIKLGGKKAYVTVLFADIRGFTSMSENMTAEEVSIILNEYFTEIEPIITKYNGVINKFIGDAVMAIFGEPIQDINHPTNAVKCANEMLRKVEILKDKWLLEGKPKIEIGIGINTGEAFVGNIGSEKRLEYTVIGDMVNLASRIESYNKVYKTNLLISNSTYQEVSNLVDVIKISEVTIRGKSKKMDIYEVLRVS